MALTANEKGAVTYYTGLGYLRVNGSLRGTIAADEKLRTTISALDSAVEKSKIEADVTVYRGYPKWYADYLRNSGVRSGSVLHDDAFLSTSKSMDVAKEFAEFPDGVLVRIRVPKGSKGLDATPYSVCPEEEECIFPRGTRLRVTGYDKAADVLDVEIA